jgi:hypothetical protein
MTSDGEDSVGTGAPEVAVPERAQRINSLIFIVNNSINFLTAPVLYVGVLHAAILKGAGASDTLANLPSSIYSWMTPIPVLIAWFWSSPRSHRPLWLSSYLLMAAAGAVVALLCWGAPPIWQARSLAVHAACIGMANGVMNMCQWEMITRSVTAKRRAWTLGVTFGLGPMFAVVGSCVSQVILSGKFLNLISVTPLEKPTSYIVLFGATVPALLVAATLVCFATMPTADSSGPQPTLKDAVGGLRDYFTNRVVLVALVGFLLTYAGGSLIMNNLGLYAKVAIGEPPENYTGEQMALRFGCKSLFGFVLGWLLARYHRRAPALATTLISIAGIAWALGVPGRWYLFSFGFLGAGELFYVYYMNYIVGCAPAERVRQFTAYTNLSTVLIGFVPLAYGMISDAYGLRASFVAAIAGLVVAVLIVGLLLPKEPPRSSP